MSVFCVGRASSQGRRQVYQKGMPVNARMVLNEVDARIIPAAALTFLAMSVNATGKSIAASAAEEYCRRCSESRIDCNHHLFDVVLKPPRAISHGTIFFCSMEEFDFILYYNQGPFASSMSLDALLVFCVAPVPQITKFRPYGLKQL